LRRSSGHHGGETCASRVAGLDEQLRALERQREDLEAAIEDEEVAAPGENDLADIRARIVDAMLNGSAACRKALLEELVGEGRITARRTIQLVFCIPGLWSVKCPEWCPRRDSNPKPWD
jgi:hypothetical protein